MDAVLERLQALEGKVRETLAELEQARRGREALEGKIRALQDDLRSREQERAALLAKKSVLRPLGSKNPDPELDRLESDILTGINRLGIGPQGLGGRTTSLAVHILLMPCHIASFPLAVNIQCHAQRHKETEI